MMTECRVYAAQLEKRLIEEFKQKFRAKIGYEPIVITKTVGDDETGTKLLTLDDLRDCIQTFAPFNPSTGEQYHFFSKNRKRELVELRNIFCAIARNMRYTSVSIGQFMNGRDHTTVLHSIATFNDLYETSDTFRQKYNQIFNYIIERYESPDLGKPYQVESKPEPAVLP